MIDPLTLARHERLLASYGRRNREHFEGRAASEDGTVIVHALTLARHLRLLASCGRRHLALHDHFEGAASSADGTVIVQAPPCPATDPLPQETVGLVVGVLIRALRAAARPRESEVEGVSPEEARRIREQAARTVVRFDFREPGWLVVTWEAEPEDFLSLRLVDPAPLEGSVPPEVMDDLLGQFEGRESFPAPNALLRDAPELAEVLGGGTVQIRIRPGGGLLRVRAPARRRHRDGERWETVKDRVGRPILQWGRVNLGLEDADTFKLTFPARRLLRVLHAVRRCPEPRITLGGRRRPILFTTADEWAWIVSPRESRRVL